MTQFANKVAIVTGSSSGIGAATAKLFASQGASVTLHGRNADNLKNVFDECVKAGGTEEKLHMVLGEVTNEQVLQSLVNETVQKFGHLDILVNNAGVVPDRCDVNGTMETFDRTLNVNLRSVVALSKLAMPHIKSSRGNIVNVSSVAAIRSNPAFAYYCIAKIGVDSFTRSLALELGPSGARVNSVKCVSVIGLGKEMETCHGKVLWSPASVRTALWTRENSFTAEQQNVIMEGQTLAHPIGRIGEPDDVAHAIAFLADEKSSWITGINLPVDGAYTLTGAGSIIMKQSMAKMAALNAK